MGTVGWEKSPATVSHWKAFTVKLGHPTWGPEGQRLGKVRPVCVMKPRLHVKCQACIPLSVFYA